MKATVTQNTPGERATQYNYVSTTSNRASKVKVTFTLEYTTVNLYL